MRPSQTYHLQMPAPRQNSTYHSTANIHCPLCLCTLPEYLHGRHSTAETLNICPTLVVFMETFRFLDFPSMRKQEIYQPNSLPAIFSISGSYHDPCTRNSLPSNSLFRCRDDITKIHRGSKSGKL